MRSFFIDVSYLSHEIRSLQRITARDIIRERKANEGRNKIEQRFNGFNWKAIWNNIHFVGLSSDAISAWYKTVNNIVNTNDRLYEIGLSQTNLCGKCKLVDSLIHRFTCSGHIENWKLIRQQIAFLTRSSTEYIMPNLLYRPQVTYFPSTKNNAINWLLGKYVSYIINRLGPDNDIDFRIYMQCEFNKISKYANHKKKYGNMLKIVFERMGVG